MRNERAQRDHDSLVGRLTEALWARGYRPIAADLPTWADKPREYNGYRPDIEALAPDGRKVLAEVELCDDIEQDHPTQQLRAFGKDHLVILAVPRTCYEQATNWATVERIFHGVNVEVWSL